MSKDTRAWLTHLEQFGIKLGLETISAMMEALGHPERAYPVLHVAGTNGKGSVSAMAAAALTASGVRCGRYTSPHLIHLEERFAIDGRQVAPAGLDAALGTVRDTVERLRAAGTLAVEPTYFEATTAAAFLIFRAAAVQAAVVEVGLGGRFDATNIVRPLVTAITSVDMDHEAQLGFTLAAIAAEKAGTIKRGVPVVLGPLAPEARAVVEQAARAQGAPVVDSHADTRVEASGRQRPVVTITTPSATYGPLRLALAGRHQLANAVVAVRLLETAAVWGLPVDRRAIEHGLIDVRWPARLETIDTSRGQAIVDGAHNPAGARALASYLEDVHPGGLPLVFGAMRDKSLDQMLTPLAPLARPLVLTRAPGSRAAAPGELAAILAASHPGTTMLVEPDVGAALDLAWDHGRTIAVAGSLYLAGDVLARLGASVD
jgi:dihydrofolate synthase / folylpolyglutamate synthase